MIYTLIFANDDMHASHRFSTSNGCISLVQPNAFTNNQYEIYSVTGDLFEDVERYTTLDEAMKRIVELLK